MNKPPGLNFLSGMVEADDLGSVRTAPLLRLLRPATLALWLIITAAQVVAFISSGATQGMIVVAAFCVAGAAVAAASTMATTVALSALAAPIAALTISQAHFGEAATCSATTFSTDSAQ